MILIPVLLLALLVVLAGLFLLAKARKENLGRVYFISSYVAAGFGILVFIFGITAGILMAIFHCKHGGSMHCGKQMECPMMHSGCGMHQMHGENCGESCSEMNEHNYHGNCSGESCAKGHGHMKMSGDCCHGEDEKIEVKEVIIKDESADKPEIKVEVEGKTK